VSYDSLERETLDALSAPLCADLIAGDAPDLLGVRLEKSKIKLISETVD